MLEAYLDESFNNRTLCVGGWLAPAKSWRQIEEAWRQRIDYERRKSELKGFPPISRYHASDCSNFRKQFARKYGWDENRQRRLTKRIIEIINEAKPAGIVIGGGVDDYLRHFTGDKHRWKEGLYYFSVIMCLYHIADFMEGTYPRDRVKIFYERGALGGMAEKAFKSMKDDPRNAHISKYFDTMIPKGWEDCLALQPADFIAYEGFKRVDGSLHGRDAIRKSLQALLGKRTTLIIGHFSEKTFEKMVERKKAELRKAGFLEEGDNI